MAAFVSWNGVASSARAAPSASDSVNRSSPVSGCVSVKTSTLPSPETASGVCANGLVVRRRSAPLPSPGTANRLLTPSTACPRTLAARHATRPARPSTAGRASRSASRCRARGRWSRRSRSTPAARSRCGVRRAPVSALRRSGARAPADGIRPARRPLHQLHDDGDRAATALQAVHVRDVRVIEACEHFRFPLEARLPLGVGGHGVGQHLDRHGTLEIGVGGSIHLAQYRRRQWRHRSRTARVVHRKRAASRRSVELWRPRDAAPRPPHATAATSG